MPMKAFDRGYGPLLPVNFVSCLSILQKRLVINYADPNPAINYPKQNPPTANVRRVLA